MYKCTKIGSLKSVGVGNGIMGIVGVVVVVVMIVVVVVV
jgi:hypothetical protein